MNLQQLRFIATVEWGTMTRAAAEMHVSQPGLTRSVRDLEREIGAAAGARRTARVTDRRRS